MRQAIAAAALFAALGELALGLAVQRVFLPSASQTGILRLWWLVALLGVPIWLAGTLLVDRARWRPTFAPADVTLLRRRLFRALMIPSLAAVGVGLWLLVRDLTSEPGAWLWFAGLIGVPLALSVKELPLGRLSARHLVGPGVGWRVLAVGVAAVGLAVRLLWLDQVPAFVNHDESEAMAWAMAIFNRWRLPHQNLPLAVPFFSTGYHQNVPLGGYYLYALAVDLLGETLFALRIVSVIWGTLAVVFVYLLLRDCVRPWAALAAAFLMAFSHNHLWWSRSAVEIGPILATSAASAWLLLRGLRSEGYLPWFLAGVLAGAGVHAYWGVYALVPVFGLTLAREAIIDRDFLAARWRQIGAMALGAVFIAAPLLLWYRQNPSGATERGGAILLSLDRTYPGLSLPQALLEQIARNARGLAVSGDPLPLFYPIGQPFFDPVVGALLLAAVFGLTATAILRTDTWLSCLWLWVPTLPIVLFTDRGPAMSRLVIALPAVYLVVGFALDRIGALAERAGGRIVVGALSLPLMIGLVYAADWNAENFFALYPRVKPRDSGTEVAQAARDNGASYKTYAFVAHAQPIEHIQFSYPAARQAGDTLYVEHLPVAERGHRDGYFVLDPAQVDAEQVARRLPTLYPSARPEEHRNAVGQLLFTAYRVPAAELNARAPAGAPYFEPDAEFGRMGSHWGETGSPRGIAVGADGQVFVADSANRRIVVYRADGRPVAQLAVGKAGERLVRPWDLVVGPDDSLLALDRGTRWIHRFSSGGSWLGQIGGPAALINPAALAAATDGSVLVADLGPHALVRLAADGAELARSDRAAFEDASGLAAAADSTVYLLDGEGWVRRFDAALRPLGAWAAPANGRDVADPGQRLAVADADGGAVYVVDPAEERIGRYTPDGRLEWTVGRRPDSGPWLGAATSVAVDRAGSVYTLDRVRSWIHRFDVARRPR